MSEITRYLIQKTQIGTMMKPNPEGNWISAEDFDRVTAERDAALAAEQLLIAVNKDLQQRLTAADERVDVLEGLLRRAAAFTHDFENPISLRRDIDAAFKPAEANLQQRQECTSCNGKGLRVMGCELTECPTCDGEGYKQ